MDVEIKKSENDKRDYKVHMFDNGIKALFVHDSEIKESSMALGVPVGSYMDKIIGVNGVAHYLEHMLFMGNDKYKNGEYQSTVSEYNGEYNAFTENLFTMYYFVVDTIGFDEVSKMLLRFFINPALDPNYGHKEIEAVNSEFSNTQKNDIWRQNQLVNNFSKKSSHLHNFSIGNSSTLVVPNINEKTREMYSYYSSEYMFMTVVSNLKYDEILKIINNSVLEIPKRKNAFDVLKFDYSNPFDKLPLMLRVMPIKKESNLFFKWYIDYSKYKNENMKYAFIDFLTHVIGCENNNGLCQTLKKKLKYAYEVYVSSDNVLRDSCIVSICVNTTKLGNIHKYEIMEIVYDYIGKLMIALEDKNSLLKDMYEDVRCNNKNQFKYISKSSPDDYARFLVQKYLLNDVKLCDLIVSGVLLDEYNDIIRKILLELVREFMTRDKMIYVDMSVNDDSHKTYEKEKYYGTKYHVIKSLPNVKVPGYDYTFFIKNDYIVKNIDKIYYDGKEKGLYGYEIIEKNSDSELYHQFLKSYNSPKACIVHNYYYNNDFNIENNVYMILYYNILNNIMESELYLMGMGNYKLIVGANHSKMSINVYGHTDIGILTKILDYAKMMMFSCYDNIKKDIKNEYEVCHQEMIEHYNNIAFEQPITLCTLYANSMINNKIAPLPEEILKVLMDMTYKKFRKYVKNVYNNIEFLRTTTCVMGYINESDARKLYDHIKSDDKLCIKHKNDSHDMVCTNVEKLNGKRFPKYLLDENNICLLYVNFGFISIKNDISRADLEENAKKVMMINILQLMLHDKFFNEMRTEKQLGYIVAVKKKMLGQKYCDHYCMMMVVQSPSRIKSDVLEKNVMTFFKETSLEIINEFNSKKINMIKKSLINKLLMPFQNMESHIFHDCDIIDNNIVKNIEDVMVDACNKVTKNDVIEFYKRNMDNYFVLVTMDHTI